MNTMSSLAWILAATAAVAAVLVPFLLAQQPGVVAATGAGDGLGGPD